MVEIIKITPSSIELKGVAFTEGDKVQRILEICHKWKHMYKEGFPYGRKTRRRLKERLAKWGNCPQICFTYLVTDDNVRHNMCIHILVSDIERLRKKYSQREIDYYMQMFTQNVADEIVASL